MNLKTPDDKTKDSEPLCETKPEKCYNNLGHPHEWISYLKGTKFTCSWNITNFPLMFAQPAKKVCSPADQSVCIPHYPLHALVTFGSRIEVTWSSLGSEAEVKHNVIEGSVCKQTFLSCSDILTGFKTLVCMCVCVCVNSGYRILGILSRLFTMWNWRQLRSHHKYTCTVRPQEGELCAILALGFWNFIYIYNIYIWMFP